MPTKFSTRRVAVLMLSICTAIAAFTANSSSAFSVIGGKWTLNRTVVMHLSLGPPRMLSDGFASFNESAANALNVWNQHLVHLKFRPRLKSPLRGLGTDGDTSVFFSETVYGDTFGSRVLAITLFSTRGSVAAEADVLFNNALQWDSYRGGLRTPTFDLHRVALHEFGHVLGLDHPDEHDQKVVAIMNSTISNIESLQTDDINGAQSLYGNGPAYLATLPAPALVNLSTRAFVGTGDNVLIGGFIVTGSDDVQVVLRGIGPSLPVAGTLPNPKIELRDVSGALIASNDDWMNGANKDAIIALGLAPNNDAESAILAELAPGAYTTIMSDAGGATGNGLVELFATNPAAPASPANISTRGFVQTGDDVMIGGFILTGTDTRRLLLRAIGPSLGAFGVSNALLDPTLELHDENGALLSSNDNWRDTQESEIAATGIPPSDDREAAIVMDLAPSNYTAIVRGANGTTGVALVEAYDVE